MRNWYYALRVLIRFVLIKIFDCRDFKFTYKNLIYPHCVFNFASTAHVELGTNFSARYNTQINTRENGELAVGDNVFFNSNCVVTCHGSIRIGDNCKFGPGTMMFDHDHDMSNCYAAAHSHDFAKDSIIIGKDCWFGAGCIILKGTTVGDHCVFGAGSIIKGIYDDNSIVVQKRTNTIRSW